MRSTSSERVSDACILQGPIASGSPSRLPAATCKSRSRSSPRTKLRQTKLPARLAAASNITGISRYKLAMSGTERWDSASIRGGLARSIARDFFQLTAFRGSQQFVFETVFERLADVVSSAFQLVQTLQNHRQMQSVARVFGLAAA